MMTIRAFALGTLVVTLAAAVPLPGTTSSPLVQPNSNTVSAGKLRDSVLTVGLTAQRSVWRFSTHHAAMTVEAFSEAGKAPVMPGPFLRVPAGTQLRIAVRHSLSLPLTRSEER